MTGLVIVIPVLGRPHRVCPVLESARSATPDARVLFVCDPDDLAEIDAVDAAGAERLVCGGRYAYKINRAIAETSEPLIFTGADDLRFHPGWFAAAKAKIDGGAEVVGVQDRCNPRTIRGEHATHFLATRRYAELGQIDGETGLLCEVYAHNAVDDELVATAERRGVYAFAGDAVVEHLHPMAGTAPTDATYEKGSATLRDDKRMFYRRAHLWH